MNIYIEKVDDSKQVITPGMAAKLRNAWTIRHTDQLSQAQKDYLQTIKKVHYSPEQVICFHHYTLDKTLTMRINKLYVLRCAYCNNTYTTDHKPE